MSIGVVTRDYNKWNSSNMGDYPNAWAYRCDGLFVHNCHNNDITSKYYDQKWNAYVRNDLPKLNTGDELTVTLRQGVVTFYRNGKHVHEFTLHQGCGEVALAVSLRQRDRWLRKGGSVAVSLPDPGTKIPLLEHTPAPAVREIERVESVYGEMRRTPLKWDTFDNTDKGTDILLDGDKKASKSGRGYSTVRAGHWIVPCGSAEGTINVVRGSHLGIGVIHKKVLNELAGKFESYKYWNNSPTLYDCNNASYHSNGVFVTSSTMGKHVKVRDLPAFRHGDQIKVTLRTWLVKLVIVRNKETLLVHEFSLPRIDRTYYGEVALVVSLAHGTVVRLDDAPGVVSEFGNTPAPVRWQQPVDPQWNSFVLDMEPWRSKIKITDGGKKASKSTKRPGWGTLRVGAWVSREGSADGIVTIDEGKADIGVIARKKCSSLQMMAGLTFGNNGGRYWTVVGLTNEEHTGCGAFPN